MYTEEVNERVFVKTTESEENKLKSLTLGCCVTMACIEGFKHKYEYVSLINELLGEEDAVQWIKLEHKVNAMVFLKNETLAENLCKITKENLKYDCYLSLRKSFVVMFRNLMPIITNEMIKNAYSRWLYFENIRWFRVWDPTLKKFTSFGPNRSALVILKNGCSLNDIEINQKVSIDGQDFEINIILDTTPVCYNCQNKGHRRSQCAEPTALSKSISMNEQQVFKKTEKAAITTGNVIIDNNSCKLSISSFNNMGNITIDSYYDNRSSDTNSDSDLVGEIVIPDIKYKKKKAWKPSIQENTLLQQNNHHLSPSDNFIKALEDTTFHGIESSSATYELNLPEVSTDLKDKYLLWETRRKESNDQQLYTDPNALLPVKLRVKKYLKRDYHPIDEERKKAMREVMGTKYKEIFEKIDINYIMAKPFQNLTDIEVLALWNSGLGKNEAQIKHIDKFPEQVFTWDRNESFSKSDLLKIIEIMSKKDEKPYSKIQHLLRNFKLKKADIETILIQLRRLLDFVRYIIFNEKFVYMEGSLLSIIGWIQSLKE